MTVRVMAMESCSATHLLSVSRKRSRRNTELLHEGPQWPLRVGLDFTRKSHGIIHTNCLRVTRNAWHFYYALRLGD